MIEHPLTINGEYRHLATVEITPELILACLCDFPYDGIYSDGRVIRLSANSLPIDAVLVHTHISERGTIVMTLESDSFPTAGSTQVYKLPPPEFQDDYDVEDWLRLEADKARRDDD